jgi:hypothetical protein
MKRELRFGWLLIPLCTVLVFTAAPVYILGGVLHDTELGVFNDIVLIVAWLAVTCYWLLKFVRWWFRKSAEKGEVSK